MSWNTPLDDLLTSMCVRRDLVVGGQKGMNVYSCVLQQKMLKIRDLKNGEGSEK